MPTKVDEKSERRCNEYLAELLKGYAYRDEEYAREKFMRLREKTMGAYNGWSLSDNGVWTWEHPEGKHGQD